MDLDVILQHLLPPEILEHFTLVKVVDKGPNTLELHLDEKAIIPTPLKSKDLVSNGFDQAVTIQDFPLRGKPVYLIVRRKKWKEKSTGKIFSNKWNFTAEGTSYSKEFASFLKELFR